MTNDTKRSDGGRALAVFVIYLKELALPAWVEAARARPLVPGMRDAELALHGLVRRLDHPGDVFAAKDSVLDALQRFESAEGRRLTRSRSATQHLRSATENAALAVLVRELLSDDDFQTLYSPFERDIPAALLFGLPQ